MPGITEKIDVLDMIISVLVEHENRIDQLIHRLEEALNVIPNRRAEPFWPPSVEE